MNDRRNNDFNVMNPRSEKTALSRTSMEKTKTMLVCGRENGKNKESGY